MNTLRRQSLIAEYGRLCQLDGHTPQSRGTRLNYLLGEMLESWGVKTQVSVRTTGEIDAAFALDGTRYVLEAKWEKRKADTGHIAKLQKRVRQRLAGTYGIFLSMSGYSNAALSEISIGERLEVLLLDRSHFEAMLSGLIPPEELLTLVHDRASFRGDAYSSLTDLLASPSTLPKISFGPSGTLRNGVFKSSAKGVSGEVILSDIDSRQLGISALDSERMLLTTDDGILDVDIAARTLRWAAPVRGCHRNALQHPDGSIIFTRKEGVASFDGKSIRVLAGALAGNSTLMPHPDGALWAFSNGDLTGEPPPAAIEIAGELGSERRNVIDYPSSSALNAAWLSSNEVLTVGNPYFTVSHLPNFTSMARKSPQSNPMGLAILGDGAALTVGDGAILGWSDIKNDEYRELAELTLMGSGSELATASPGRVLLASYYGDGNSPRAAVLRLYLPSKPTGPSRALGNSGRMLQTPATQARLAPVIHRNSPSPIGPISSLPKTQQIGRIPDSSGHNRWQSPSRGRRSLAENLTTAALWVGTALLGLMELGTLGATTDGTFPDLSGEVIANVLFGPSFAASLWLTLRRTKRIRKERSDT